MAEIINKPLSLDFSSFYECHFPLIDWFHGTDILNDIVTIINQHANTFQQLYRWKNQGLIFPKPTLSSRYTLVFWVHETIIDRVLQLHGVRGGFRVSDSSALQPDSSTYKGKKQSPRPRRILLDIGTDTVNLVQELKKSGLEIEIFWTHVADLLHYEIVELCTSQYIDLIVTTNPRLLMPPEEWLEYLIPHRTRIIVIPEEKLKSQKELAKVIYRYAYAKRKFKTRKHQYHSLLTSDKEEA